jgi:ferredoxin-type protein NapH
MLRRQRISQVFFTAAYNSYIYGFFQATIYQGRFKLIPCAGFNCHSCPSAVTTCPIGALQLFASFGAHHMTFYVFGFLGMIGAVGGRIACGWACPFGLLQDLMAKIPVRKLSVPRWLEKIKYVLLVGVVLVLAARTFEPWFCKAICPAGTLQAGIPLLVLNSDLRQLIGTMFYIKLAILCVIIVAMVYIKRPFCRLLCPLGAIYALFNRFSLFTVQVDTNICQHCDTCYKECPVSLRIYAERPGVSSCVRCYRCVKKCPVNAISVVNTLRTPAIEPKLHTEIRR